MDERTVYTLMKINHEGGVFFACGYHPGRSDAACDGIKCNPHSNVSRLGEFLAEDRLVEDAWVVDCRPLHNSDKLVSLVVGSPMPSLRGPSECQIPDEAFANALKGEFGAMAQLKRQCPDWTGLDHVSVEDYAMWWLKNGARVGRYQSGQIEWIPEPPEPQQEVLL